MMNIALSIAIAALISYLLGSCNFSIIVVRLLKNEDVRNFGSHNAGLTNTLRCFGKGCALLTLIGDLSKGVVAVTLSRCLCRLMEGGLSPDNDTHYIGYIAGFFAIIGHIFPIYYGFKGGKGVLVGVSTFIAVDPVIFFICNFCSYSCCFQVCITFVNYCVLVLSDCNIFTSLFLL